MDYNQMSKHELIIELHAKDLELSRRNARIKQLLQRLELFRHGQFLSRNTRKAVAMLLANRDDRRADFDVKTLENYDHLDIYTYYDEFGMKLCLRTTDSKIT